MQISIQSTAAAPIGTSGSISIGPYTVSGNIAPVPTVVNLVASFNSITVPSGAIGVWIIPPSTNSYALTLKGVTGDTGISIPAALPSLILFGTAPATIGITVAGIINTSGYTSFIFF